jgi:hypothetical protein
VQSSETLIVLLTTMGTKSPPCVVPFSRFVRLIVSGLRRSVDAWSGPLSPNVSTVFVDSSAQNCHAFAVRSSAAASGSAGESGKV